MQKTRIVNELGERSLLLPEYVNRALAANDRVKYYFTVLQAARDHADRPQSEVPDLSAERQASGVDDGTLDEIAAQSSRVGDSDYHVPQAARLHRLIVEAVEEMLVPIEAAAASDTAIIDDFPARLRSALAGLDSPGETRLSSSYIGDVTRAAPKLGDSLHLLVMDLHKTLNWLQTDLAQESIDGARVYGIEPPDRALVKAFMTGLNATAPLKFDHPGLGTTATRTGERLVIQNDIGTTDAHVLVVHVEDRTVTLIYTDIHLRRVRFFKSLFESSSVQWDDIRSQNAKGLKEGDTYYLNVGRYEARDEQDLARHLTLLGSRIVFLIDWNKARKRLRNFVGNKDATAVLKWAAEYDYGHRGFLELGGERLVFEALENATTGSVRYGERLDKLLGRDTAVEYLKYVLRTASEGLLEGHSVRLIRDKVKAELLEHFHTAEQGFLGMLSDHASLTVEVAGAVRDALQRAPCGDSDEFLRRTSQRAKHWETRADELMIRIHETLRQSSQEKLYRRLSEEADDITDNLEEAAFLLSLLPAVRTGEALYGPLQTLADLVVEATRRYVMCLESARHVQRGGAREDLSDFLEAVDQIITLEHETDIMEREITASLIERGAEFRQLHLFSLLARRLEKAADSVNRCGLMLRDHVLREVMVR